MGQCKCKLCKNQQEQYPLLVCINDRWYSVTAKRVLTTETTKHFQILYLRGDIKDDVAACKRVLSGDYLQESTNINKELFASLTRAQQSESKEWTLYKRRLGKAYTKPLQLYIESFVPHA